MAERANAVLGRHWKAFARQNYFDSKGLFFSALISGPLLLVLLVVLVRARLFFFSAAARRIRRCVRDRNNSQFARRPFPQINFMITAGALLIKLKRAELRDRGRRRAVQGDGGPGEAATATKAAGGPRRSPRAAATKAK